MQKQTWTIKKLLDWMVPFFNQKGVDAPRLTAELLLSNVLGLKRIELYVNFAKVVDDDQLTRLRQLVKRTADFEPFQYLIGKTEFYSLEMKVSPSCLIPRPETELLVERAIEFLRTRPSDRQQKILDLCTGSGCIAVAIAKNFSNCHITATDICEDALKIAFENINAHNVQDKIALLNGDLFAPIVKGIDNSGFDLIVSNPPYISKVEFEKLDKKVKDFEPHKALYGGTEGLDIYLKIAEDVQNYISKDGVMILEIGYAQAEQVKDIFAPVFSYIKVEKDLAQNDRVITLSNQPIEQYKPVLFEESQIPDYTKIQDNQ